MSTNIIESIRLKELSIIYGIQTKLSPFEPLFLLGSHFGDPQNGYLYYFLISLIFLSHSSAFKILWTSVISEWINLILKWVFNDQRPYWWSSQMAQTLAKDNNTIIDNNYFKLKQFSVTCETGPGFPSGHVMITASVLFCFINELTKHNAIKTGKQKLFIKSACILLLMIVSFGRIYISAHFPDQCFFGLITGIIVALIVDKLVDVNQIKVKHHIVMSLVIITTSYVYYELMNLLMSESADWSLRLAQKYCFDIKHVKADTTPLYVIWRTSGAMIGIGIAFDSILGLIHRTNYLSFNRNRKSLGLNVKLINILLSTIIIVAYMHYSKPDPTLSNQTYYFYLKSFFQFMMIPIVGLGSVLLIDNSMRLFFSKARSQ